MMPVAAPGRRSLGLAEEDRAGPGWGSLPPLAAATPPVGRFIPAQSFGPRLPTQTHS